MKKIVLLIILFMFQLSSCSTLIKFDNWKKYTKWESDDGSVILCSYDMTNAGFGQIIDNNNTLDIYWVAASPNGSSLRLMINEKSESNTFDIIMSFEYSKIVGSNDKFRVDNVHGNVYTESKKYIDYNYWLGRTFIMRSTEMEDEMIDAKYFRSLFYNDDLNLYFYTDLYNIFEPIYICKHNSSFIYLHFADNNTFVIKEETDDILSTGTYTTKRDEIDLYFLQDTIFDLQNKVMSLVAK